MTDLTPPQDTDDAPAPVWLLPDASLFAAVRDALLVMDGDGRCIDANPAACELLGYSREELVGLLLVDLVVQGRDWAERQRQRAHRDGVWLGELELRRKDGSAVPVEAHTTRLPGEGADRLISVVRDLTERRRLEAAHREAEAALQESRDYLAAVLQGVADGITVQDVAGRLIYANDAAARLSGFPTGERLLSARPADLAGQIEMLDEAGRPIPWESLPGRRALAGETPEPALIRYRIAGTGEERWSVVKAAPVRDAEGRVRFAVNVFSEVTALQGARQRLAFLSQIGAVLGASLDQEETLRHVAALAVPGFADCCVVDLLDEASVLRRRAVAHDDPAIAARIREVDRRAPLPRGAAHGPGRVLASGQTELLAEITDEMLVAGARDAEHLQLLRDMPMRSQIVAPLTSRGLTLGTITFAMMQSGRRYAEEDAPLAEEIARRCAVAIDNARLFREAQAGAAAARVRGARMAALAGASRAFAEASLNPDEVLETVARQVVEATGDGCIVRLLSADGERLEAASVHHPDPAIAALARDGALHAAALAAERLTGIAVRSAAPVMLVDAPDAPLRDRVAPEYRPFVDRGDVASALLVPLIVRGRAIGAMAVTRGRDRPVFSDEDQAFLRDFADRAALAIDSARRYEAEHAARAEAEAANRAKDDFLSVLSHELRTPLTSMLGWVQMLRRGTLSPEATANALQTIERSARAQAQLVGDILDLSRIITGKMRLEPAPIDPREPVQAAVESVRPAAEAKGVTLAVALDPATGAVLADADRLQQVVWNLLANAIKFTPRGGRVEATLAREGDDVAIAVRDTGAGIDPAFLPHVFERFRQADASSTREHGGLGLGLAIVRHIAEAHGGAVQAASDGPGRGATFIVRIPAYDEVTGMLHRDITMHPAAGDIAEARIHDAADA